jgi:hypothetical protein
MSEQRVRVMVGEGRSTRRGLLRFVLENEGYDVVAEAESTLELAQKLVVYRPDVVVLDDSIDASAVGMIREVLPQAKVILVWPRGVSAVGADARLEPSEVLSFLGPTVARVMGRGSVLAPPRPRATPPVVVVPEAEPVTPPAVSAEPAAAEELGLEEGAAAQAPPVPSMTTTPAPADVEAPPVVEPEPAAAEIPAELSDVMMAPASLEAPRWTYSQPSRTGDDRGSRWIAVAALLVAIVAVAVAAGALLSGNETVGIVRVSASTSATASPGASPTPGGGPVTSEQPGTYRGIVRIHANGTIRLSADGDLRLRVTGLMRIVATGQVRVRGNGIVKTATSTGVRVHGNGSVSILMSDGRLQLRLQGTLAGHGRGTVRISGQGRFLIHHQPL